MLVKSRFLDKTACFSNFYPVSVRNINERNLILASTSDWNKYATDGDAIVLFIDRSLTSNINGRDEEYKNILDYTSAINKYKIFIVWFHTGLDENIPRIDPNMKKYFMAQYSWEKDCKNGLDGLCREITDRATELDYSDVSVKKIRHMSNKEPQINNPHIVIDMPSSTVDPVIELPNVINSQNRSNSNYSLKRILAFILIILLFLLIANIIIKLI